MEPIFRLPPYEVEETYTAAELAAGDKVDWGLALLGVPDQWTKTQGLGARVAVLDTGCDLNHPDLKNAIVASKDFTGSPFGVTDGQGHGTHCAGIIAARKDGTGVVGVAPECSLLVGKVLGDDGSGRSRWIVAGIDWAIAQGAEIISMSLGSAQPDPGIRAAIDRAVSKGILVICAAGNDGRPDSVNYPARWALAVAAFDKNRQLAPFSSQGPEVDIAAPGVSISSTFPLNRGGFATLSGTSMATPFVAGVVALAVASRRAIGAMPILNEAGLKTLLQNTATDAGPPGKDVGFGWGLIDPAKLIDAKPAEVTPVGMVKVTPTLMFAGAALYVRDADKPLFEKKSA